MGGGGSAKVDKFIGVAISDFTDDGLTALKWASDFLKLPDDKSYSLCIVLIRLVKDKEPCDTGVVCDNSQIVEAELRKYAGASYEVVQNMAWPFHKRICARIFEGGHIQTTLQYAIDNFTGLETVVVGCAGEDGGSQTQPQFNLELSGCSIVLAKIAPPGVKKTLSVSAPVVAPRVEQEGLAPLPLPSHQPPAQPERAAPRGSGRRAEEKKKHPRNAGA